MKYFSHKVFCGIAIWLLCTSCTKFKNRDRHVIGQVIDTNTNEPLANTALVIFVLQNTSSINRKLKSMPFSFSTDANGFFDAVYRSKRGQDIAIAYPDGIYESIHEYVLWDTNSGTEEKIDAGIIRGYSR